MARHKNTKRERILPLLVHKNNTDIAGIIGCTTSYVNQVRLTEYRISFFRCYHLEKQANWRQPPVSFGVL
jgi:hypothetical protein